MSHDKHVLDGVNKDVGFMGYEAAKEYYLGLADGWTPYNPDPVVVAHSGVRVVRDDLLVGTKTRAGDLLASKVNHKTLVYCQPRVGLAGVSLCDVAKHRNKDVVLFMPACHEISLHQACCIEQGAKPIFRRIAAMPNLNKWAEDWAKQNDAFFIPLGLRHELATAGIVYAASTVPEPEHVFVAISTGVLSRALQIAWPNAQFHCVAVARNLQAGEAGRVAEVISHPYEFQREADMDKRPPFPSVATYDSKAWVYCKKFKEENPGSDVLFWNVGTDPVLQDHGIIWRTDSSREWGQK